MVDCNAMPEPTVELWHFANVVAFTIEVTSEALPTGIVHLISYTPVFWFRNGDLAEIYQVDEMGVVYVTTWYKNLISCRGTLFIYTFSPSIKSLVSTYVPIAG